MIQLSEAQLVIFEVGDNCYALDIADVHEILRVTEITPLPQMPPYMEGVINLRGKVLPVLNLRRRLGLDRIPVDQHTRIILVKSMDKLFGLIVDRVLEVNTYTEQEMEGPEAAGLNGNILRGIVKKPGAIWLVIDLEHVA
ncbi:MAG: chemotaxis protein CheW [Thermoanaerobacterales bacterium]|nr:chemotaxis protein CheW [Bacillota bacterium]MDI6906093.1 chemotaxis protein CheW [Thermoanaerobacterales bacterium]